MDKDYTLRYLQQTKRYQKWQHAIHPRRVYPDPYYPAHVTIVELPFPLDFRCDTVSWHASRLSHRLPVYRSDRLEFFAVLSVIDAGQVRFHILFVGEQVFQLWEKWVYFVDRNGVNLLQYYYQRSPIPKHPPQSYEHAVINYERGCIFARHQNLNSIMAGITVG